MSMIFIGTVTKVSEPTTGESAKGKWARRDLYVEEDVAQYPNSAKFTIFKSGDYVDYALDKFEAEVGDKVSVEFNINLKESKGRYFNDVSAWKVTVTEKGHAQPANAGNEDDLPF